MFKRIIHIALLFVHLTGVIINSFASIMVYDGSQKSIVNSAIGSESVKACEAMISSSILKVNIGKLESLSKQISMHAAKLDNFKVKLPSTREAGRPLIVNKVDVFFGFKPEKLSEDIVAIPKFSRPDPSTYLTPSYISDHLNKFNGGVTKFVINAPSGAKGPPTGGTFILPKNLADDLISQSNGSASKLEELLRLDPGTLGASPFRVDVTSLSGIKMPSENEFGANTQWLPGGKTGGGILEATVDQIQPGTYTFNSVFQI